MSDGGALPTRPLGEATTMWWGLVAGLIALAIFELSLLFSYLYLVSVTEELPAGLPATPNGLVSAVVLVVGSASLIVAQGRSWRPGEALLATGTALVTGLAFVVIQVPSLAEWPWRANAIASITWVIFVVHVAAFLAGLLLLVLAGWNRVVRGAGAGGRPLRRAALLWHYLVAFWLAAAGLRLLVEGVRA